MKYILVIGDGMSDDPVPELGGKTPLEYLDLPAFGVLAGSETGLCRTVPEGVPAGSDTAILNIFGYDPRWSYTGRSVLEAAGVGVTLKPGEVSMRVNLCAVEEIGGKLTPIRAEIEEANKKIEELRKEMDGKKEDAEKKPLRKEISDKETAVGNLRSREEEAMKEYSSKQPLVKQIIDLALLQSNLLKGEALSEFIRRSVTLL